MACWHPGSYAIRIALHSWVEAKTRNGTGGGTAERIGTEQLQIVEEPVMNGTRVQRETELMNNL